MGGEWGVVVGMGEVVGEGGGDAGGGWQKNMADKLRAEGGYWHVRWHKSKGITHSVHLDGQSKAVEVNSKAVELVAAVESEASARQLLHRAPRCFQYQLGRPHDSCRRHPGKELRRRLLYADHAHLWSCPLSIFVRR